MINGLKFPAVLLAAALAGAPAAYAATGAGMGTGAAGPQSSTTKPAEPAGPQPGRPAGTALAMVDQTRHGAEPPRTQGDVTYISGGVGKDSVRAMREIEHGYNLRLMFAVKRSGEYLADVRVKLMDAKGKTVLDAVSDGPYFFAKVPPGRYQVVAVNEGNSITRSVDVSPRSAVSQPFYWSSAS